MINTIKKWLGLETMKESQQSQTSAQSAENNSNSLTIERDIIPDTPFTIVGTEKDGYWLTMGKHRITKPCKTKKEVLKKLKEKDWTLITAIMIAFVYDRELVDKAYTRDTSVHPQEKAVQTALELNND